MFSDYLSRSCNRYTSLFITAFFLLSNLNSVAQSGIHGIVVDENGKPLANANVLLLNAKDSGLIKGVIVSDKGTFSFVNNTAGFFIYAIFKIPASNAKRRSCIPFFALKMPVISS
jgi:hypothetical protein